MRVWRIGEFRAGSGKKALLLGIPLIALVLVLLTRLATPSKPPATPAPSVEALDSSSADPELRTVSDVVRRGDTFSDLLIRNRLSVRDMGRILDLTRKLQLFSPRALQAGQELTLTRDDYGRLSRLVFSLSPEETYVYEMRNDSLIAYQQAVVRDIRLRKFEGEIESSFDEAIHKAGGEARLTLKVADVFACDVDFLTEVRKGDRFDLLVEEKFVEGEFVGYGEVLYGRYEGEKAKSAAVYFRPEPVRRGGYYDLQGKALKKSFLSSPLNYRRISSYFSKARFHPILRTYRPHHGVDYAAAQGTPVVAVADGTVVFRGWQGGYGNLIRLRHGGGRETVYGHLSKFADGIRSGSRVSQGQLIGRVGRTGLATGPHLHFEVVMNGQQVDPLHLKSLPGDPIAAEQLDRFRDYAANLERLEKVMLAGQVVESFDSSHLQTALAQLQTGEPETPVR
jgi:murein DD-endopeptidase MepM/ murein hydrolase activator NlpD